MCGNLDEIMIVQSEEKDNLTKINKNNPKEINLDKEIIKQEHLDKHQKGLFLKL